MPFFVIWRRPPGAASRMACETAGIAMKKLNVALCGSGRIGRVHAANIAAHPGINLTWVADPMTESAEEVATQYGARPTGSTADVFADASLDAVVICSPTPTHVQLIEAASARGIAVLCEKPIDLDIERVRSCRETLAAASIPLMMGFNRRFDPAFAAIRQRVAAGEIGRLEHLSIVSRDPAPAPAAYIAASGGIFRDMTIHDLDMARFFIRDIVEVTAHGANVFSDYIAEAGDFDSAVVTLRGRNGELVSITNSRHSAYGYDQRLEAFGSGGMLRADNISPTTVRSFGSRAVEAADPYEPFFLERYAAAYRRELDHFVEAVNTGTPCSPGFDDGISALILADTAAESAATGRTITVEGALQT
ncbi:myo-inositol 2-dehydrogenase/D-chiro-inositol 1-dehydrogenase [Arthrobacter pascens]|nr:myo-inositol 2-dehydrogenase/D-chiro-inositol 1-dehydrogenase [Arthrobacter pascens]